MAQCTACGGEVTWARTPRGELKAINTDLPTKGGDVVLVALVDNGEARVLPAYFSGVACPEERYSFHVCPRR